jgi:hypothetical protein
VGESGSYLDETSRLLGFGLAKVELSALMEGKPTEYETQTKAWLQEASNIASKLKA